ncbi:MAG TPA: hypothetical protein VF678_02140 [bacterium]
MKKLSLLIVAMFFAVTTAFAFQCPSLMKKFDAAVGSSKASAAQMSEAKGLRAKGEELHKAGKHAESVEALNKALKLIGA